MRQEATGVDGTDQGVRVKEHLLGLAFVRPDRPAAVDARMLDQTGLDLADVDAGHGQDFMPGLGLGLDLDLGLGLGLDLGLGLGRYLDMSVER